MGEVLVIPQVTESERKVLIKDLGQRVTFEKEYIHFKSAAEWDVYDEELGMMTRKMYYNDMFIDRLCVFKIEMYYFNFGEKWVVNIGESSTVFINKEDAQVFYNKAFEWKYKR